MLESITENLRLGEKINKTNRNFLEVSGESHQSLLD